MTQFLISPEEKLIFMKGTDPQALGIPKILKIDGDIIILPHLKWEIVCETWSFFTCYKY